MACRVHCHRRPPCVKSLSMLQMNTSQECASASVVCASWSRVHSVLLAGASRLPANAQSSSLPPQMVGYALIVVVFPSPALPPPPTPPSIPSIPSIPPPSSFALHGTQGPGSSSTCHAASAIPSRCLSFVPPTIGLFPRGRHACRACVCCTGATQGPPAATWSPSSCRYSQQHCRTGRQGDLSRVLGGRRGRSALLPTIVIPEGRGQVGRRRGGGGRGGGGGR
jgi:hypothetical protein